MNTNEETKCSLKPMFLLKVNMIFIEIIYFFKKTPRKIIYLKKALQVTPPGSFESLV